MSNQTDKDTEKMTDEAQSAAEETVATVEHKLEQCQISLAEWQEKYARLTADLDNFKKRTLKERAMWDETARAELLIGLLSIVDNFDRAMEQQQEVPAELQSWADGIQMIHDSFTEYLKTAGVTEMPYDQFDPEQHEALIQVDSDDHDAGAIVTVMEKGYLLNDRVLRPAKVSVAK